MSLLIVFCELLAYVKDPVLFCASIGRKYWPQSILLAPIFRSACHEPTTCMTYANCTLL